MWCSTSNSTCSCDPSANKCARNGNSRDRSKPACAALASAPASSASLKARRKSRTRHPRASTTSWRGTPSRSGKIVRKLSPAQQHPQAQLPAPKHPAHHAAEPPAASCRSNHLPPAAPKTTADAAQTTTELPQDEQPRAAPHDPPALPANTPQADKPSALQTGCGSKPQHQGSIGSG